MPIIVVPKDDGGKHLVINYRICNKVTRKFTWPMPKVEDFFSKLNGEKCFSTLDLRAGYHHIPLDKSSYQKQHSIHHLANMNASKYLLDLHRLQYFQELMTGILKEFNFAITYLDYIIIFCRTVEEHLSHIKEVFEKL